MKECEDCLKTWESEEDYCPYCGSGDFIEYEVEDGQLHIC